MFCCILLTVYIKSQFDQFILIFLFFVSYHVFTRHKTLPKSDTKLQRIQGVSDLKQLF